MIRVVTYVYGYLKGMNNLSKIIIIKYWFLFGLLLSSKFDTKYLTRSSIIRKIVRKID